MFASRAPSTIFVGPNRSNPICMQNGIRGYRWPWCLWYEEPIRNQRRGGELENTKICIFGILARQGSKTLDAQHLSERLMWSYCGFTLTPGAVAGAARALRPYMARPLWIGSGLCLRFKFGLSQPHGARYGLWLIFGHPQDIRCGGGGAREGPQLCSDALLLAKNKFAASIGCARKHWATRGDSGFGSEFASRGYSSPQLAVTPRSPLAYKYWGTSISPSLNHTPSTGPPLYHWL
ncbi:hypothetical protein B0H15DRAFT_348661 [Mycena belliarum]|uniref:Uncharacterized protein n=1 Tax=Mycena belliarum TaxID=1033014 RepID=A0AAD6U6R5_9AGAR|nr:hypothetical protein B0H15DRAFT_348380 [Mycena belliae]KAJ7086422.1 hypothetical protein B0H15DRAFT_348661 [Mycena belliae]